MTFIPFARHSVDQQYSGERLKNWFFRPTPGGVGEGALIGRSGLDVVKSPSSKQVRAMAVMNGDVYAVVNGTVYKYVIATDTISSVGSVNDNDTVMAASGTEVAIVAGGTYYICDGSSTSSQSTGALSNPVSVVFADGFFVVAGTVAGRADGLTSSALDDGTTFSALDFAFAENAPDGIRGLAYENSRLLVFGAETVETFYNAGAPRFPFVPDKSQVIPEGCAAGLTIAESSGSVFFLGEDKAVYQLAGGMRQIQTPEIKETLAASTVLRGFTFTDRGAEFYALGLSGKPTLVYDLTTGFWCDFSTGEGDNPWIVTCGVKVDGVQYFGTTGGDICTPNSSTSTDAGMLIEREAISAPLVVKGNRFSISQMKLRAETSNSATVSDPQIVMQMSGNGVEWGTERWRSLGGVGEYNKEIRWNGLGSFTHAQARFRVTDAVRADLYGMDVEIG